ncbi:MAG: sulfotransferase, partial [Merismopedia sp. SIO2A8]|nr:sulfotransferase [Merismopedia sp. SIO2A8]
MIQKPNFIIIGAMKCATSTLHEQLALQPNIFMSELKEPNFFSNDEEYDKGLESYWPHFTGATPTDLCGESSTHYTKLPTYPLTIERLQRSVPEAKFIYVMRHPINRLV